ncbi:hypothetical protein FN846DRAFT_895401 [Sphaerosporella brunnea]|uniref:Uncharacterized protein n=1 Tax=Sphaerosporella brunnea TaxID=1250544 RepID=A0A5J5EG80_9PEZI|nr:hypothetical protein FN846DRAFT_895401 [Sphaerosporella brunnea]
MTVAEEYARFGLAAPAGNEPKFYIDLVKFIIAQGLEIYLPKNKKTGSKSKWARVLTVAFNRLSLSTWYRAVFAGLSVVAEGNNLYRFGTQMWAIGHRSQKPFGTQALGPLPQRPVLELPEELQANDREEDGDDARGADGARRRYEISDDEDDARGAGAAFDPRDAISDDDDDARGVGAAFDPRYKISDHEDDAHGAGTAFDRRREISDDARGVCSGLDRRRRERSEDGHDAHGVGAGFDRCRTELKEAIHRATDESFAAVMDHFKTTVGAFHQQSRLAGHAKLEAILSNGDADAAEIFVQKFKPEMSRFQVDCDLHMLTLSEAKLAEVLKM